jgi:hypothetical protein
VLPERAFAARRAAHRFVSCALLAAVSALPAAAGTSAVANPTWVFDTPGDKQVTLQVCGPTGLCTQVTKTVTVLDPTPRVTSAAAAASSLEVGQLLFLSGTGTGKPLLTYTWKIESNGIEVASLPGESVWWDTVGAIPGSYTARLEVSNSVGIASSSPLALTLNPPIALDFYTVEPCRILDTRNGLSIASGDRRSVAVGGSCGIPFAARAVAANITAVAPTGAGFLSLFPGNYPLPATSTVNFAPGQTRANLAVLPLATDGTATLAAVSLISDGGSVHLIVDVTGYFLAP